MSDYNSLYNKIEAVQKYLLASFFEAKMFSEYGVNWKQKVYTDCKAAQANADQGFKWKYDKIVAAFEDCDSLEDFSLEKADFDITTYGAILLRVLKIVCAFAAIKGHPTPEELNDFHTAIQNIVNSRNDSHHGETDLHSCRIALASAENFIKYLEKNNAYGLLSYEFIKQKEIEQGSELKASFIQNAKEQLSIYDNNIKEYQTSAKKKVQIYFTNSSNEHIDGFKVKIIKKLGSKSTQTFKSFKICVELFLGIGEYRLECSGVPDEYSKISPYSFKVTDSNESIIVHTIPVKTKLEVRDEYLVRKAAAKTNSLITVYIGIQDKNSKKAVPNYEFKLVDNENKSVSLRSPAPAQKLQAAEYHLQCTSAPIGYMKFKDRDITINPLDSIQNYIVEVEKSAKQKPPTATPDINKKPDITSEKKTNTKQQVQIVLKIQDENETAISNCKYSVVHKDSGRTMFPNRNFGNILQLPPGEYTITVTNAPDNFICPYPIDITFDASSPNEFIVELPYKAETKPEPKEEPKAEPKPEPKEEPKAEPKVEPKAEQKPESKVEVKAEPKPEPKEEPKVEQKPEPKVEVKAEPKVEPKAEQKPESKVEVKAEPKPEPKEEPKLEAAANQNTNLYLNQATKLSFKPTKVSSAEEDYEAAEEALEQEDYALALKLFEESLSKGCYDAALRIAEFYYEEGRTVPKDLKKTFEYLRLAAEHGNGWACCGVGENYIDGDVVEKNIDEAINWLSKGINSDDLDAETLNLAYAKLGNCYFEQKNYPQAIFYLKMVKNPDEIVIWSLADAYAYNDDFKHCMELLQGRYKDELTSRLMLATVLAMPQNPYVDFIQADDIISNVDTSQLTAEILEKHKSIRKFAQMQRNGTLGEAFYEESHKAYGLYNYQLGLMYTRVAANLGKYAKAQYDLGHIYDVGELVTRDYALAIKWYKEAMDQGLPEAYFALGQMYYFGYGVEKDIVNAEYLCRQAADRGYEEAQKLLPKYQQELRLTAPTKTGTKNNPPTAPQSDASSQTKLSSWESTNLASITGQGYFLEKKYAEAFMQFSMAADQNDAYAQYMLGYLYQHGLGVDANLYWAKIWYDKAAKQNYQPAKDELRKIRSRRY